MKKIKNKLIVSDFDGTLITSSHTVPEDVKSAINEYVACGGIFAVCTGRMISSILPRVRELGLKGLVVGYEGAAIAEIESGKFLKKDGLPFDRAAEVCDVIHACGFSINTYSDEVLYTDINKDNPYLMRYERITGISAVKVEGAMSEFLRKNKLVCQKVTSIVMPEDREKIYSVLLEKFGSALDVTCSADVLVEVAPYNCNKGEAVKFLSEYYNVPLSSSVAIGDNLNDVSMIKVAGTGVAVGNAVEGLKSVADYVTVSNNDSAVAKIIEKFGFI